MNETIDKIKKLMALANNNPNAEEADSAMKFAARLMMQHNIKESDIKHVEQKAGKGARHDEDPDKWRTYVANGIARLYNCRAVWYVGDRTNSLVFIGRPVNTEACDVTYPWVINQIEALYKAHLRHRKTAQCIVASSRRRAPYVWVTAQLQSPKRWRQKASKACQPQHHW